MSFPAKYPGRCSRCDDRFDEGEPIERSEDGYSHADCEARPEDRQVDVTDDLERDAKRPVCQRCWMVRPCEHDE